MGHMDPWRPQLTILSSVERTYSAPFLGVSRLNWLLFCWAMVVSGRVVEGEWSYELMAEVGVWGLGATAVLESGRAADAG